MQNTTEVPTELLRTLRDTLCTHVVMGRGHGKHREALEKIDLILNINDDE